MLKREEDAEGERLYYLPYYQALIFSSPYRLFIIFPPFGNFVSRYSSERAPSSYRRKIALMSDRKWQAGGGQRKRKKLVSKGKLISGHFVSTRSQPSSALSLPLLCIEYSRFSSSIIRFPASNPADPITVPRKDRQRSRLHRCIRQKGPSITLYAVLRNLECK